MVLVQPLERSGRHLQQVHRTRGVFGSHHSEALLVCAGFDLLALRRHLGTPCVLRARGAQVVLRLRRFGVRAHTIQRVAVRAGGLGVGGPLLGVESLGQLGVSPDDHYVQRSLVKHGLRVPFHDAEARTLDGDTGEAGATSAGACGQGLRQSGRLAHMLHEVSRDLHVGRY